MFAVKPVDEEEEQRVTKAYKLLESEFREATEEEFRTIVIPYLWYKNQNRFNFKTDKQQQLQEEKEARAAERGAKRLLKEQEKANKPVRAKAQPKEKKLTKAQTREKYLEIWKKLQQKEAITEEEQEFYNKCLGEI